MDTYTPFWGMHLLWWGFWIFAMVGIFGYNVPERVRVNSLDPHIILRRRLAKGEITEDQYNKIITQFRDDEELMRREVTSQSTHATVSGHPVVDGLSFSATWAVLYSLCALLYVIAPEAILTATSKLFHGMSFTQMAQTGSGFSFGDFLAVLTIGAVYTFVAGVSWSFVHSFFLRRKSKKTLGKLEARTIQKSQLRPQTQSR